MFTRQEVAFLAEFERVMKPVAFTLDFFQGDNKNSLLGCLLPHILRLKLQLQGFLSGVHGTLDYTREIVTTILEKVCTRFDPFFEDPDYQMATCFHPAFKLEWVVMWDVGRKAELRERMVAEVAEHMRRHDDGAEATPTESAAVAPPETQVVYDSDDDGGLSQMISACSATVQATPRMTVTEKARSIVKTWEGTPRNSSPTGIYSDGDFLENKAFMDIFMKTNTGVVSSAACERFFSQGKDTLADKRSSMSGSTFESLMVLRGNAHLWWVPAIKNRREKSGWCKPNPILEKWASK